ncbi:MAG TPA: hypothetical protein VID95_00825, partial [Candidatus Limnocylindrales bacterium]
MTAEAQGTRSHAADRADATQPFDDLASVLAGISAGVSVQDASGRLIYVNDDAARMAGFESPAAMLSATPDALARFSLIGEDGRPFDTADLP